MAKHKITDEVRKAVNEYSAMLLATLRLQDWIVYLAEDLLTKDAEDDIEPTARVQTQRVRRYARLELGERFFADDTIMDDELRTQVLIHEHLHLHFEQTWHYVTELIDDEVHHSLQDHASEQLRVHFELAIDQMAYALASLVPSFTLPR